MFGLYARTTKADDWKQALADPEKQWRRGYSARTLANCWEAARGFPPEIAQVFTATQPFLDIQPLIGLAEHKVPMPGRGKDSQNDLFVLARANGHLVSMMVEGKVSEPFGETLLMWNDGSPNRVARLSGILDLLALPQNIPTTGRYQLLHRMASAVVEAKRFEASSAVMLIHSFSPVNQWLEDYQAFLALYGRQGKVGELTHLTVVNGINLYAAWAHGDSKFLES